MVPVAFTWNGLGISIIMSGLICQPSGNVSGGGASLASPSGAPLFAQVTSVSTSAGLSVRSLAKWPYSANHGGIFLVTTATFMALAHGRASWYVISDIGATSPGRWQPWQFFCRMGRTSLLNVGELAAMAATPIARPTTEMRSIRNPPWGRNL